MAQVVKSFVTVAFFKRTSVSMLACTFAVIKFARKPVKFFHCLPTPAN